MTRELFYVLCRNDNLNEIMILAPDIKNEDVIKGFNKTCLPESKKILQGVRIGSYVQRPLHPLTQ